MAKLRKGCAYRNLNPKAYTRISKYRKKSFARTRPASKIVKYNMGNVNKPFDESFYIVSKESFQLRHNAIESARQTANRKLEGTAGKGNFFFRIRTYPHHILRENPLAAGAGADRMSTGMKHSFGKVIGVAARIKEGQIIAEIHVEKQHIEGAKKAVKAFINKIPVGCYIEREEKIKKTQKKSPTESNKQKKN